MLKKTQTPTLKLTTEEVFNNNPSPASSRMVCQPNRSNPEPPVQQRFKLDQQRSKPDHGYSVETGTGTPDPPVTNDHQEPTTMMSSSGRVVSKPGYLNDYVQ